MQNLGLRGAVLGLAVLAATPAHADDDLGGSYEVKFEPIASNCDKNALTYPAVAVIRVDVKGDDLKIDVPRTPLMVGKPSRTRKLSAKSPRPGHTTLEGMDGVFSVAGRVTPEGMLSLVMVGEYQVAGKPLCTQTWNLSGLRGGAAKPDASDKPGKKK